MDSDFIQSVISFTKAVLAAFLFWGVALLAVSICWTFLDPISVVIFAKAHEAGKAVAEWLK